MQFLILAHDGTDAEAPARRAAHRAAHLALGDEYKARGQMIAAAALLDDDDKMIGSAVMVNMPDRATVDAWLAREPYVTGGVWKTIEVMPCRLGPSFAYLAEA